MPIYKCEKCNKEFNKKSAYASHSMRIITCIKDNNNNNECEYCNKIFSNKYNLRAHLKICKENIIDDHAQHQIEELKKMFEKKFEEQQKKFEEQQRKIEDQQKQINELSHTSETNNNITVNENSHNTTTNNVINIYSSGKEDLSRLSHEDVIKLCTSGTYYPLIAAEILHCNEKYPEFQNVLISNLRATTGLIKINDKWVTKSQDEVLNNMMNVDKKHISTLIKDLEVEKKLKVKLESTQDEIDTNECKEHHKDKIKQKLYDASNMIKKHKKQSEKK